jgi:hypothetical protein
MGGTTTNLTGAKMAGKHLLGMRRVLQLAGVVTLALGEMTGCPRQLGAFRDDACQAPSIDWMEVSQGIDSKTLVEVAAKLEAAAKLDATQLKMADGSANANFLSSFRQVTEELKQTNQKVQVTQAFFERATAYRHASCNLERQIKNKTLTSKAAIEKAETTLIDLSNYFGNLETKSRTDVQSNP